MPKELKPAVPAGDAARYFREASEWDHDQVKRSKESERKAWKLVWVFAVIAILSVGANFMLFPLKEVQHEVIRVDSVTGITDVIPAARPYNADEETDRYWLKQYVKAREGWLFDEFMENYRKVGLLSSADEQKKWYDYYRAENPASPYNQYGPNTRVRIKFRSVTYIDKRFANVRFTKIIEQPNQRPRETYWIATIKYRYVTPPTTPEDRELNPLGWQQTEYRVDPESAISTEVQK